MLASLYLYCFTSSACRICPTLDDVASSFRHIGLSLSEFVPPLQGVADGDIGDVWTNLPGLSLATAFESKRAEFSLDIVAREQLQSVKDFHSLVTGGTIYSFQGADSCDHIQSASKHQDCYDGPGDANAHDLDTSTDNGWVHSTRDAHNILEVSDPWERPSLVNVVDVTDDAPSTVAKQLSNEPDREPAKAELELKGTLPADDCAVTSWESSSKTENNISDGRAIVPTVQQRARDKELSSDYELQHQAFCPRVEPSKPASHVTGKLVEDAVGVRGTQYKIPKLKLKVSGHSVSSGDVGEARGPVIAALTKDQKVKKKKRKNRDVDNVPGMSAVSRIPKKAKHKDKVSGFM